MANSVTGKITYISSSFNVDTRNGAFQKREVWVAPMYFDRDSGDPSYIDKKYSVSIEFTRDNCNMLDSFNVDDEVVIPIRLRGNVYEKDGVNRCMTTIEGIAIRQYQRGTTVVVNEAPQVQVAEPVVAQVAPQPSQGGGLPF